MEVRKQQQLNPIGDEVAALTAIVRPLLSGLLYALKADVVSEMGGHEQIKLKMLPRLYRPGDGDIGICFEYAVHDALNNKDPRVTERLLDAIKLCNIKKATAPKSILFGLEKSGAVRVIDTARNVLTDESRTLAGGAGQPPKLQRRLSTLAAAFSNRRTRLALPYSISGLWKADLFVGSTETQQWVGTSVKINPQQLEGANGLRIGIVPTKQGKDDRVRLDSGKGLVICPLHHDADFMQAFYEGWRIVQAFVSADAKTPKEAVLPRPVDREICRILEERREFPIVDVLEALLIFGQPELLDTNTDLVSTESVKDAFQDKESLSTEVSTVVAPVSLKD
ncbi:hypothetical protein A6U97_04385 [Agrobacterium tumefaciens]|uniref:hypothetical protein n=1 Tax=Agrobacterium tumefaciens TaxID=358 RepID=UPI00080F7AF6|nr:hypothetical protein A6U97_04385 [Agrobacterium tumefaciens]